MNNLFYYVFLVIILITIIYVYSYYNKNINEYFNNINDNNDNNCDLNYDNYRYELKKGNEKIKPYDNDTNYKSSIFCNDNTVVNIYNNNKNNYNKKSIIPSIDSCNFDNIYYDNNSITNENIRYNDEKIMNGSEFFNNVKGYNY